MSDNFQSSDSAVESSVGASSSLVSSGSSTGNGETQNPSTLPGQSSGNGTDAISGTTLPMTKSLPKNYKLLEVPADDKERVEAYYNDEEEGVHEECPCTCFWETPLAPLQCLTKPCRCAACTCPMEQLHVGIIRVGGADRYVVIGLCCKRRKQ